MPYVYQEYPKWIAGPEVIVQNAAEERCIRRRWSRDIGRAKANALQCSRTDALALELAPEILALRARGSSYRAITQALNECSRPSRGKEITLSARPWSSLILRDHILGEMIYDRQRQWSGQARERARLRLAPRSD